MKSEHLDAGGELAMVEIGVAAEFLEEAAKDYIDHSCNDYSISFSPENADILRAAYTMNIDQGFGANDPEDNPDPDERSADGTLFISDHWLMSYLAARCHAAKSGSGPSLSSAELRLVADLLDVLVDDGYDLYGPDSGNEEFTLLETADETMLLQNVLRYAQLTDASITEDSIHSALVERSVPAIQVIKYLAYRARKAAAITS